MLLTMLWREWLHAVLRIARLSHYFAGRWAGSMARDIRQGA